MAYYLAAPRDKKGRIDYPSCEDPTPVAETRRRRRRPAHGPLRIQEINCLIRGLGDKTLTRLSLYGLLVETPQLSGLKYDTAQRPQRITSHGVAALDEYIRRGGLFYFEGLQEWTLYRRLRANPRSLLPKNEYRKARSLLRRVEHPILYRPPKRSVGEGQGAIPTRMWESGRCTISLLSSQYLTTRLLGGGSWFPKWMLARRIVSLAASFGPWGPVKPPIMTARCCPSPCLWVMLYICSWTTQPKKSSTGARRTSSLAIDTSAL